METKAQVRMRVKDYTDTETKQVQWFVTDGRLLAEVVEADPGAEFFAEIPGKGNSRQQFPEKRVAKSGESQGCNPEAEWHSQSQMFTADSGQQKPVVGCNTCGKLFQSGESARIVEHGPDVLFRHTRPSHGYGSGTGRDPFANCK